MKTKIIAIVGMCGSGKSMLADALVEKDWGFVRFGQITLDIIKERELEPNEANQKKIRESVRKEHGMGAYATLNIPKFDKILEKQNLVADGLYSWDEYKILKDYYNERLQVVAVYAPPQMRYERLSKRFPDADDTDLRKHHFTKEEARSRDFSEIENLDKGGPIAMADHTILNTDTLEAFKEKIDKFINTIA